MTETTRRAVVLGAGGTGLAAVLSACAGYGDPATQASVAPPAEEPLADETAQAPEGDASPTKKAKAEGKALAGTDDIPSGGGKVFARQKVVVVQTGSGDFKAYSAICTHAGCAVTSVSNGTINCPCHGSKFAIEDGSVAAGPAERPLAEKKIKVDGDKIMLL
ncbi:ubiquinol-cytochrome c reductase iron-sulfur subunit [Nonomuraea indica]|uniref:Cytochrome bc1 complex Rieske iron-sulfur subunit n=1 Tax=Nonomuraea indica TaxID=1581193 RepID=A0ABW8A8U0_9ACTN